MNHLEAVRAASARRFLQNERDILEAVHRFGPLSLVGIVDRSGYSMTCVERRIGRLFRAGTLVRDRVRRTENGGATPWLYRVEAEAYFKAAAALDVAIREEEEQW